MSARAELVLARENGPHIEGETSPRPFIEYPTLDKARDAAALISGGRLPIFARDITADGKKVFSALSYSEFLQRARENQLPSNHFYEVLCSPDSHHSGDTDAFFDLELAIPSNPDFQPTRFRQEFDSSIKQYVTGLGLPAPSCLWAYASNSHKYSAHVRVIIPHHAFAGPKSVGLFFRGLDISNFRCKTRSGLGNVVDTGVYTSNRLFRLLYASKYSDPSRILLPEHVQTNEHAIEASGWILNPPAFLDMLLQRNACKADVIIDLSTATPQELDALTPTNCFFPRSKTHSFVPTSKPFETDAGATAYYALTDRLKQIICNTSPWVGSLIQECGNSPNLNVIYFSSDSHNCLLAGRAHRSNHVKFRVVLSPIPQFQQSCHDHMPPCDKLSNAFKLPPAVSDLISNWHTAREPCHTHSPQLSPTSSPDTLAPPSQISFDDCMF